MRWMTTIPLRLRSLFRGNRAETELDEELRFHLERQMEQSVARGMTPRQARDAALHCASSGASQRFKKSAAKAGGYFPWRI